MIQLAIALLLALVTAALTLSYLPETLGRIDLVQYWASSKLLLSGLNPYNPDLLHSIELSARPSSHLVRMWNPPFIFPFIYLFGLFDFEILAGLWCWITLASAAACYALLQKTFQTTDRSLLFDPTFYFFISFFPIADIISWGQISVLLLISVSGFIILRCSPSTFSQIFAGTTLSVSLIKPHLLFLLYGLLVLQLVRGKDVARRQAGLNLLGFCIGAMLLAGLSAIMYSDGFVMYFSALGEPPIYFKTPTIGSWLQELTGSHTPLIRLLPSICMLIALPVLAKSLSFHQSLYLGIIPLSLASAPYGWGYDQVMILPLAVYLLASSMSKKSGYWITGILLLANVVYIFTPGYLGQQVLVWYPLLIFVLYCAAARQGVLFKEHNDTGQT